MKNQVDEMLSLKASLINEVFGRFAMENLFEQRDDDFLVKLKNKVRQHLAFDVAVKLKYPKDNYGIIGEFTYLDDKDEFRTIICELSNEDIKYKFSTRRVV